MESAKLTPLSDKVYSYSPTKGTTSARVAKPPALLFVTRWIIKVSLVVSLWGFSSVYTIIKSTTCTFSAFRQRDDARSLLYKALPTFTLIHEAQ